MLIMAALLLFQTAVPSTSIMVQDPADIGQDVVVTGLPLSQALEALRRCELAGCPPKHDIALSLSVAERQFAIGELQAARDTLRFARGRNKRYADILPAEVARLLALDADVALVLNLGNYGRIGRLDAVDALRRGLPENDARIGASRLISADSFAEQGRFETASNLYDRVARDAERYGWKDVRGAAMLRSARLYLLLASINTAYALEAGVRLKRLQRDADPSLKAFRDASVVMEARIAQMSGDKAGLAAALKKVASLRMDEAQPLSDIKIDLGANGGVPPGVFNARSVAGQWIEFSFLVAPDGFIRGLEEVERSDRTEGAWADIVRESIARRRYAPLNLPPDAAGLRRVERYVLTPNYGDAQGRGAGRYHVPVGPPIVTMIDKTPIEDQHL